jgi:hypothetical protein
MQLFLQLFNGKNSYYKKKGGVCNSAQPKALLMNAEEMGFKPISASSIFKSEIILPDYRQHPLG